MIDRQADRQTERQTGRQAGRQAERETDRHFYNKHAWDKHKLITRIRKLFKKFYIIGSRAL